MDRHVSKVFGLFFVLALVGAARRRNTTSATRSPLVGTTLPTPTSGSRRGQEVLLTCGSPVGAEGLDPRLVRAERSAKRDVDLRHA